MSLDFPLFNKGKLYKKANSNIKYSRFINLEMWCIQKPHDKMSQITMVLLCGLETTSFHSRNNKDSVTYIQGKNLYMITESYKPLK